MPLCCEVAWSWRAHQPAVCFGGSAGWHMHRTLGSGGDGPWPTAPACDSDAIRCSYEQLRLCSWANSVLSWLWQGGGDPWTKWQGAKVGCMWDVGAVVRTWWLMYVPPVLDTEPAPKRKFLKEGNYMNVLNAWNIKDISSVLVSLGLVILLWGLTSLCLSLVISVCDTTRRKAGFS